MMIIVLNEINGCKEDMKSKNSKKDSSKHIVPGFLKLSFLKSVIYYSINSKIFKKSLILYFFLMMLNLGLSIIIILYNQSNLISKVELQEKLIQNNKFKQTLLDGIAGINKRTNDKKSILSILNNFFMQNNDSISTVQLFDETAKLIIAVPDRQQNAGKSKDDTVDAIDKRLVLNVFFKYNIDKTDFVYEIASDKFLFSYMILPVKNKIYILKTGQALESFSRFSSTLYTQVFTVFIILLFIHAIFSMLIYKNLILPIKRLNMSTKQIIHGNLNNKIQIIGNDEIGELSISFNEMIVSIQKLKSEALDSNPLTGLPGNTVVMNQIQNRINEGKLFAFGYIDLNSFKPFNDRFGFEAGDRAISLVANILKDIRQKYNNLFVGHIGGDDFVYISDYADSEKIGNEILQEFSEKSKNLFPEDIVRDGFYISKSRNGEIQKFKLLSISIGVVTNSSRKFASVSELNQEVAKMKKYAKSFEGNVIKTDKRENEL